jgi:protein ImuB
MGRSVSRKTKRENVERPTPNAQSLIAEEIVTILHKWGIHTLGQLAALDKEELAARLGPEAVRLWERANGQSSRLLKFVQPPESFDETFEFDHEIETAEPLLFMLRRFLEQFALRLSAIYLVAKELSLRISFSNKQVYERSFKIPQPTNDVDLLFRMLQTHLENFKSEHPIVAVGLSAEPIRPASQQFGLFETTLRNPSQLYETLARLTALLGNNRVGTPVLEETHRPDAFRIEPFSWNVSMRSAADMAASTEEKRDALRVALRRFRPAAAASVLLDENIPAHLRSAQINSEVADQRGPYLLSGNWWDEKLWARTEWDLQLENSDLVRCHEDPPCISAAPAALDRVPLRLYRPCRSSHSLHSQGYGVTGGTWKIDGIYD